MREYLFNNIIDFWQVSKTIQNTISTSSADPTTEAGQKAQELVQSAERKFRGQE